MYCRRNLLLFWRTIFAVRFVNTLFLNIFPSLSFHPLTLSSSFVLLVHMNMIKIVLYFLFGNFILYFNTDNRFHHAIYSKVKLWLLKKIIVRFGGWFFVNQTGAILATDFVNWIFCYWKKKRFFFNSIENKNE